MEREDEVDKLRNLLAELRIQQQRTETAINRVEETLNRRTSNGRVARRTVQAPRELTLRDFRVGQRVQILNPNRGEHPFGRVSYVGTRFVGITKTGGGNTRRIPRNLAILDREDGQDDHRGESQ